MNIYYKYRLKKLSAKLASDNELSQLTDKIALSVGNSAVLVKNHIKNLDSPRYYDEYRRILANLDKLIRVTSEFEKMGDMLSLQKHVQEALGFTIYYPRISHWLSDIRRYVETVSNIISSMETNTIPRSVSDSDRTRVSSGVSRRNELAYQTVLINALDDLKNVLLGGKGKGSGRVFRD